MLGKMIGALIGAKAAKRMGTVDQPGSAILGAAAVAMVRRFGIPGMIAAAISGYALKRYNEQSRRINRRPAR